MFNFLKKVGLVCRDQNTCGAIVDKHALVYPLRVRDLKELRYQSRDLPGSTIQFPSGVEVCTLDG